MNILDASTAATLRLKEVVAHANRLYGLTMDLPLKAKRGKAAGSCHYENSKRFIRINFEMMTLSKTNWDHILNDTIPHEVAHMVEHMLYGKMSHSPQWVKICKALGGNGKRCHNLMTTVTRYTYNVSGHIVHVSAKIHKIFKLVMYIHINVSKFKKLCMLVFVYQLKIGIN